jgi:hypothetical protein
MRSLLTLLLVLFCACDDERGPDAVVRFYVYSDTELASVRAAVFGGDAGTYKNIPVSDEKRIDELLFFITVERTPRSKFQTHAVVSFVGTPREGTASRIVLEQTVTVPFTDNQTSYVRIRLSAACAQATINECGCVGSTSECIAEPLKFDSKVDLQYWEGSAPNICAACPVERCIDSGCSRNVVVPRFEEVDTLPGPIELQSIYMRRVVAPIGATRLAAVGLNAAAGRFKLFVAADTERQPQEILAADVASVARAPILVEGLWRGTEVAVSLPVLTSGAPFWIGVQALDSLRMVETVALRAGIEQQTSTADAVPEVGMGFGEPFLEKPLDGSVSGGALSPYIYAVFEE